MRLLHLILLLLLGLSVQFCGKKEEKKKNDSSLAARGDCSKNSSGSDDDDGDDKANDDEDDADDDDKANDDEDDDDDGSSSKSSPKSDKSKKTSKKSSKKTSTTEKKAESKRLSLKEKGGDTDAPCINKDDDDDDDHKTKIVTVTVIATATGTSSASATSTSTSTATGTSTATSTSTSTATSTDKGKVLGLISNEVTDLPTFAVKSVYAMVDDASGKPELSFYLLPDEVRDCDKDMDMDVDLAKAILVTFSTVVGQVPVDTVDANGFPKQDTNKTTGEADNKSGMSISLDGMTGDHKGSLNFTAGKRPAKIGDAFEAAVDLQFEGGKKYKATLKGKVVESTLDPRCE